jgi:3-phenylpropionate/trans-cinnamate dioxygenase ferredoxin subunit
VTGSFKVAPLDELPDGRGIRVEIGEHRIAMFRIGDTVYAIGDRCSHAEASLSEGEVFDGEVECPRHGSAFDLATGAPQTLPATRPVPVYAVEVVDGDVYVTIDDVVPQEVAR